MKQILTLIIIISTNLLFSQNDHLKDILKDVKRDSTDKSCQILFNDFFDSFESDQGMTNPKFMTATINMYKYKSDLTFPNRQLVLLLQKYMDFLSEPNTALYWLKCLEDEYIKVYGQIHPLILLYQGESLINSGNNVEAHKHFLAFKKTFPNSTMAMVYVYKTETDKKIAKTWLNILKSERPNHWIVKKL